MENPEKISLQFELLNTYYSKSSCKISYTPENICPLLDFVARKLRLEKSKCKQKADMLSKVIASGAGLSRRQCYR